MILRDQVLKDLGGTIEEHWGSRCPDYEDTCYCCRMWDLYDELTKAGTPGYRHLMAVERALHFLHKQLNYEMEGNGFVPDVTIRHALDESMRFGEEHRVTKEEVEKLENSKLKEYMLTQLSDHWKCVGCDWETKLKEPMVIGNVGCGGCGYALLRPLKDGMPIHDPLFDNPEVTK